MIWGACWLPSVGPELETRIKIGKLAVIDQVLTILATEELYKKDLHDPDNYNGVITHLEPDIWECEVKWALESITTNKARDVMEFQLSYFKSSKMML